MEIVLESKDKKIKIYKLIWNVWTTYSIYLNWKCQSKLIKKETFDKLSRNLNLQEEINKFSNWNMENKVYLHLIDLLYKKLYQENGFEIQEAKTEILTNEMNKIFPLLEKELKDNFILAWWTAIALYLWHRESIDFDFFSLNPYKFNNFNIEKFLRTFKENWFEITLENNWYLQMDFCINWVKVTLFSVSENLDPEITNFIEANYYLDNFPFKVPSLRTLWAMKLYTMSFRKKNKDFYDLYLILQKYSIDELFNEMILFYWFSNNVKNLIENFEFWNFTEFEEIVWKNWFWNKGLNSFYKKQKIILEELYLKNQQEYKNLYFDNVEAEYWLLSKLFNKFFKK